MADSTPSTVPGCRTLHFFLDDGRSPYDILGPDFSLLRFNQSVPLDALLPANPLYPHGLLIARPDQHGAWRGDIVPPNPAALIEYIRSAAQAGVSALVQAETQG